ncbi:MAG: DUF1285 domain-containing protein [Beijerinckiaceae bacterium]
MAEEFIAGRGNKPAPGAGSAALNIEALAAAMCSPESCDDATEAAGGPAQRVLPPVEQWNPPFCGDIDMKIARDGTWFYGGTPIRRPALVRLFSTILRKDTEGYVLVTPVEKVGIMVEDAPFLAVEMTVARHGADQVLGFLTNVGDWVEAGADHPIRFERGTFDGIKPYVHMRGGLWALLARALVLDLVELGEMGEHDGAHWFGVASAGSFFPIANADEVESADINTCINMGTYKRHS